MEITPASWKQKAAPQYKKLGALAARLRRRAAPAGFVAYGALTTFTLWPLVEAATLAAQAGQPLPVSVLTALGAIAGGLGSNLLAGQIQAWYQAAAQGEPPTQEAVARWLMRHAPTQAALREEIDRVLAELRAVETAQTAVSPADWPLLARQLAAELHRLGNLSRYQARLSGSGILVQGEGNVVVAGGSAYVGGSVGGDLVIGVPDPTQAQPAALQAAYLARLLAERNQLWLGGIDPRAAAEESERLELSAVYTALLTETAEQDPAGRLDRAMADPARRPRRLSALAQLNRHRHLVLLGDPGSGKSTFVNFVAVCLAGERLGSERLTLERLRTPLPPDEDERREKKEPQPQPWDHGALLPVCIVLRDLAARGLPPAGQPATAVHLWRFLEAELTAASLADYLPLLKKTLLEEGGIFLFDGLDEVPTADQHRLHIKQLVQDVARTYARCRILVTSRTYAYQRQDWRLPGFAETTLAPFSRGQIAQFVDHWYRHVARVRHLPPGDAEGRAALLKQAVLGNPRLYALAERPLLLTLMASLHAWRGGSLPEKREQLYADSVDLLLDLWETQRIVRAADGGVKVIQPSLEQWLQVDRDKVRGLLNRLAYAAHRSQPELVGTADIAEDDLVMGLLELSDEADLQPKRLVEFLSNRAGLLLPRGVGVYTFPHRTFQEYLAACHLTGSSYPAEVADLARRDPHRWREVALLAGAKAGRGAAFALWGLVQELCHRPPADGDAADCWGTLLAGQLLVETAGLQELTAAQQGHVARVRDGLVHVLTSSTLPAVERALAGRSLARLGDPRPEATDVDGMQFCLVPAGDFWMGDGEEMAPASFLDYDYWLARFPVTHAQYMAFVDDGGYAQAAWWAEAIAAGLWQDGRYTAYGQSRNAPWDYGPAFQLANLPVVGVSWFEALAFTRWLTARWRQAGRLPAGWQVTLPSEAEWEKGARGGVQAPAQPLVRPVGEIVWGRRPPVTLQPNAVPRRLHTWSGGPLTTERANYEATEINQTSSVGAFAAAASVYGCEEMLGNVWEWTRSLDGPYPYDPRDGREKLMRGDSDRTRLRGGSWYNDETAQRCGARVGHYPFSDLVGIGFRLVLSPSDSGR